MQWLKKKFTYIFLNHFISPWLVIQKYLFKNIFIPLHFLSITTLKIEEKNYLDLRKDIF